MAIAMPESLFVIGTVIFLAAFVFWLWMLVDCATREPSEGNDRLVWVVIIVFTHIIGALIYFFARRSERIRRYGQ